MILTDKSWTNFVLTLLLFGFTQPVLAQSSQSAVLEEIVVTAQKRQQNLQTVPIAITTISSDQITDYGLKDTNDLVILTPGLNFTRVGGVQALPRIRGVGTPGTGPGLETPVATFVDGVYIGSPTMALLSLNNVQQVDVLKGPQGTLFGRNTTGGVIQITTKTPTQDSSGEVRATMGNLDTVGVDLYAPVRLSDNFTSDFAVSMRDQGEGFGTNLYNGEDVHKSDSVAMRSKSLWQPDAATTVTLSADYSKTKGSIQVLRVIFGGVNQFGMSHSGDDWDTNDDVQPFLENVQSGISVNVERQLEQMKLVSITAYRESDFEFTFGPDLAPPQPMIFTPPHPPLFIFVPPVFPGRQAISDVQTYDQMSQEFQLISEGDGPLTWVAGLYYFSSDAKKDPNRIDVTLPIDGVAPAYAVFTENYQAQDTDSVSIFGQATYTVSPTTKVTFGLRHNKDEKEVVESKRVTSPGGIINVPAMRADKTFNKLTWRFAVDRTLEDGSLVYASYDRGYKSGAFLPGSRGALMLEPEVVDALQVGIKAELLDQTLRVNASAFYYDFENIQVNIFRNLQQELYNGQEATAYGLDLDLLAVLSDQLTLGFGLSLIESEYEKFDPVAQTTPLSVGGNLITIDGNANGNKFQQTPDWTASFNMNYFIPTPKGDFNLSAILYHNDGWFAEPENRLRQKEYNVMNLSATWSLNETFGIRLWVNNALDKSYAYQVASASSGDAMMLHPGRTLGITASVKF